MKISKKKYILHLFMNIGKLLRDMARESFDKVGLCHGQARVLDVINCHGSLSQIEICQHLKLSRATLTKMVTKLEKNRLIERTTDPKDERVLICSLSSKGKTAIKDIHRVWDLMESEILKGLKDIDLNELKTILEDLRDFLRERCDDLDDG